MGNNTKQRTTTIPNPSLHGDATSPPVYSHVTASVILSLMGVGGGVVISDDVTWWAEPGAVLGVTSHEITAPLSVAAVTNHARTTSPFSAPDASSVCPFLLSLGRCGFIG